MVSPSSISFDGSLDVFSVADAVLFDASSWSFDFGFDSSCTTALDSGTLDETAFFRSNLAL